MRSALLPVLAQVLPDGYPETIDTPRRFLRALDTPAALWAIRILLASVCLILLLGLWYYDRRAGQAAPEEKGEPE